MRQKNIWLEDSNAAIKEVYLQPGEFFWGNEATRIKTLLGSCVAICVWHAERKIGGMSHCLLPTRTNDKEPAPSGRYVDETFEIFFKEMNRAATRREDYQVKVFGGGNMFVFKDPSGATVGEKNLLMMRSILKSQSMKITAEHVGGNGHRNVLFELSTGDCWVRYAGES